MEGYTTSIIEHANKVRVTKSHEAEAAQTIEITDEWFNKLSAIPFISCKYRSTLTIFREKGQDNSPAESKFKASSSSEKAKKNSNSRDSVRLDGAHVKAWHCCVITKLISPSFSQERRGYERS